MNGGHINKISFWLCPNKNKQEFLRKAEGFTIVETMIVLAVTGSMLVAAGFLISGRQNTTSFTQSTRDIQTVLQQVINDVGSGYYPSTENIKCEVGSTGPDLTETATSRGTNQDCLFIGKVVQFKLDSSDPNDSDQYNVYTVVGLKGDALNPSVDLLSAKARVVARATGEEADNIPQEFDTKTLKYGLRVSKMYYNNVSTNRIGAFGITSSFSGQNIEDSSQQVNIIAIPATSLGETQAAGTFQINQGLKAGVINPPGGVQICFDSGGTNQSALMTVGGEGRQTTVDMVVRNGLGCS